MLLSVHVLTGPSEAWRAGLGKANKTAFIQPKPRTSHCAPLSASHKRRASAWELRMHRHERYAQRAPSWYQGRFFSSTRQGRGGLKVLAFHASDFPPLRILTCIYIICICCRMLHMYIGVRSNWLIGHSKG